MQVLVAPKVNDLSSQTIHLLHNHCDPDIHLDRKPVDCLHLPPTIHRLLPTKHLLKAPSLPLDVSSNPEKQPPFSEPLLFCLHIIIPQIPYNSPAKETFCLRVRIEKTYSLKLHYFPKAIHLKNNVARM